MLLHCTCTMCSTWGGVADQPAAHVAHRHSGIPDNEVYLLVMVLPFFGVFW